MVLDQMSEKKATSAIHPSIAGGVAAVRNLEGKLSLFDDPTQYVATLETGAAAGDKACKSPVR